MGGCFSRNREERPPQVSGTTRPATTVRNLSLSNRSYPSYYYPEPARQPTPQVSGTTIPATTVQNLSLSNRSYPSYNPEPARQPTPQAATRVQPWNTVSSSHHERQHVYRPTPPTQSGLQIAVSNVPLAPVVYREPSACKWEETSLPHNESFRLVNLSEHDLDFAKVSKAFQDTSKGKGFKVTKVERVENPFLLGYYLLKKEEMINLYGSVQEKNLFHGTKKINIKQICENNFNWKLHGCSIGSRYGKGVSFSPISFYASHYSDKKGCDKVMFYVTVLVGNSVEGNADMELPPKMYPPLNCRYDTAEKDDGNVIVKFCDNEFYPKFIIHYTTPATAAKAQPKKTQQPHHFTYQPQPFNSYYEYDCYDDYY